MPGLAGPYNIWNVAWETRVSDLHDFQQNGDVIGYSYNGGDNQKWTFQHIADNAYHIAASFDRNIFIVNDQNQIRGDSTGTIFTVEFIDNPSEDGYYTVKIQSDDYYQPNNKAYWTLTSGAAGTQIILQPEITTSNKYQQMWRLNDGPIPGN